jgi:pyruvate/2-oxoacid:ferredoxin oxidoreductase alpha subunit
VGLLRPISLWPFPEGPLAALADEARVKRVLVVEMSDGQMLKDVKLAILGRKPVDFYNRLGGNIPTVAEVVERAGALLGRELAATN